MFLKIRRCREKSLRGILKISQSDTTGKDRLLPVLAD
jgi:hypothetical protein